MPYAETTSVPVERSRAEIERLLQKLGCQQLQTSIDNEARFATVTFRMRNRIVRFTIGLPNPDDTQFADTPRGRARKSTAKWQAVAQAERQRWRALFLVIKAKLESVESDIATFEEEFLAHIVMPDGQTVAHHVLPNVAEAYENKKMQRLLPAAMGK